MNIKIKSILLSVARWVLPGGLYNIKIRSILPSIAKLILPVSPYLVLQNNSFLRRFHAKKDMNIIVSPTCLEHIRRYEFAKTNLHGSVVLDAACGVGYGSEFLEPIDQYVGVDYAKYNIKYAKDTYGSCNGSCNRRFVEADIYKLENIFPSRSFDTILSLLTLEHLDRPGEVLSIFFRLIKPKGKIILSIPLNHPDTFYHKRIYNHGDIKLFLTRFSSQYEFSLKEYFQTRLEIRELYETLPINHKGYWIGVLSLVGLTLPSEKYDIKR